VFLAVFRAIVSFQERLLAIPSHPVVNSFEGRRISNG